jgi:hypothetical protein
VKGQRTIGALSDVDAIQSQHVDVHIEPQGPSIAARPPAEAAWQAEAEFLAPPHAADDALRFSRLSRQAWGTLYQRVVDIDPLEGGGPRCPDTQTCTGTARVDTAQPFDCTEPAPPQPPFPTFTTVEGAAPPATGGALTDGVYVISLLIAYGLTTETSLGYSVIGARLEIQRAGPGVRFVEVYSRQ